MSIPAVNNRWDGRAPPPASTTASGWVDDGSVVRLETAADSVAIGASTLLGTEKLRVTGGTTILDFTSTTAFQVAQTGGGNPALITDTTNRRVGVGTAPLWPLHAAVHDSASAAESVALTLDHVITGGVGANNIGTAINFRAENDGGALTDMATFAARFTDAAAAGVVSGFSWAVRNAGALTQRMFLTGAGALIVGTASITTGGATLRVMGTSALEGNTSIDGSVTINGTVVFEADRDVAISLFPNADVTNDLGAASFRWRQGHIRNANLDEIISPFTTPASFGSSQDNFSTTNTSALRVNATAVGLSITGFAGGSNGKRLTVFNVGTNSITLPHLSGSSAAANQLLNSGSAGVTLNGAGGSGAGGRVKYEYDGTLQKWVQISPVVNP